MKSRFTHVEFPVFLNYTVHVEITSDLSKSMEKYPLAKVAKDAGFDNAKACVVHEEDEPFSFMFPPYNASVGDIAHESWHVIRHLMQYCGVELDSETCAHHLGFLTQKIFNFIRRGP